MNTALRFFLSLAVAVGLIALLAWWGELTWSDLRATLGRLELDVYLSALGINVLIYVLRAWRFHVLLPRAERPSYLRLLPVTVSHNLAASVLPAKVGDASLVLYLRRCGVATAHGLALLLVSRILDLAAVCLGLGAACFALAGAGRYPQLEWLVPLGSVLILGATLLLWISLRADLIVALVRLGLRLTRLARTRLGRKLDELAVRVSAAVADVGSRGTLRGALLSLPVWCGVFLFYAVLARGFGLSELTLAEAVFGASLAVLANILPINGFAGLGTQEGGWVLGFGALGVMRDLAFETGLAAHLVYLFNISVLGFLGHLAMGLFRPGPDASEPPS